MAGAPGHRLGQIIGDVLELAIEPVLQEFAAKHSLYLDKKGPRRARMGTKLCWTDLLNNKHDLDFVLERGGSEDTIGNPAAFIEIAWRRYTKHSRAKAQEIQGAIIPLLEKHAHVKPFAGAVVAGKWTRGALTQMTSSGFSVLHIPYDEMVGVFLDAGIDIHSEESTADSYFQEQVDKWDRLSPDARAELGAAVRACSPEKFLRFRVALEAVIGRAVDRLFVMAVHGTVTECRSVQEAIDLVHDHVFPAEVGPLVRFEVNIRYTNGDRIDAQFASAEDAIAFLQTFA